MIDVVMTYYNRKTQLIKTLESFKLSSYKDFKVIIIDDTSDENQRVEDITSNFEFKINVIRVELKDRKWVEPLALINKTIRESSSDVIIFQCPECRHVGDVLSSAAKNVQERIHIAFACQRDDDNNGIWWDVHSVIHPTAYPFCIAFMKEDYINFGGFDEQFSYGTCSDEDFLDRVKEYSKIVIIDNPFVFHQYHPTAWGRCGNVDELRERNMALLKRKRSMQLQKWKKPW